MSDLVPQFYQLITFLDDLVSWQKFGTFLPGIESKHIKVIECDIKGTDQQKAALFEKWLRVHPRASWQDVLSALENSEEHTLALKVYRNVNTTLAQGFSDVRMITIEKHGEEKIQSTLKDLDRNFNVLMVAVRSALDHKLQHQQLVLVDFTRWIEHRMKWVGELSNIIDFNELFKKLHPHFDFLDCNIIVDMSEEFLNDELFGKDNKSLVSVLKEHTDKANILRCSSTIKELQTHLKSVYSPYLADLSKMPQIQIELHNLWNEATIEGLYLLIRHLLPHRSKQSILKHIEIITGSVIINVYETNADSLIAYAQEKLQFMHLIGIFALTINVIPILKEGNNVNFTFQSALLEAAKVGHTEVVQFLTELGVDVDYYNEEGSTSLMLASEGGHEQIIETLVSSGANVNIQDNEGCTPLIIACEFNYLTIVNILFQADADPNLEKSNGSNALMITCFYGHYDIAKVLIQQQTKINYQRNDGVTALMLASYNGHTHIVDLLLNELADINAQKKNGWSALMLASRNGHTQVVEQLLIRRANVDIQAINGVTALIKASENGHINVVKLLLKEDANINVQTNDGWTALMLASGNGHVQVVQLLLEEYAHINVQTNDGWTPLMLASENGHAQIVEELLKEYADVNIQTIDGWTALMLASENGHAQIVKELLKEHADVNIQTVDGWTALTLASENGYAQVVVQLLKEHADISIQTNDGWTALMIANQNRHTQVVDLLLKEH